jgi:hypothetical protein
MSPVGAVTVVNADVPFALRIPAVKVAAPEPPLATGKVPEVPEEMETGSHDGAEDPFAVRT